MPALGEEFRSAREARGLSLSDVAERLHIRGVYLAAIEDEDWKAIGAPVYVRGFMRTYARFLGLDAEDAVARFSAALPSTPAPPPRPGPASSHPADESAADRRRPSVAALIAVIVAVLVVAFVGYEFYQYRAGGAPAVPTAVTSPDAAAPAVPADESSPAPEESAGMTSIVPPPVLKAVAKRGLTVRVTETSWLRVTVDGTVRAEGTFQPGTTKTFAGKTADVRVGNAGGVLIAINGRTIGPLGAPGDVAERQFDLSGE